VLIAAGSVSVATWRRWRVVATGLVVVAVVSLPVVLPVLPENTMIRANIDKARDDFSAELGWPTVVSSIAHAFREVPAGDRVHSLILTQNYSQASAVNLIGSRLGLPQAYSGHNTYWLWLPQHASIASVVAVGFTKSEIQRWFARLTPVGEIPDSRLIDVEERGARVYWCRRPRLTTKQLWSAVKLFT